ARAMHDALNNGAWEEVARLLREEWKLRRTNAPGITTPLIEKLVRAAARQGGLAAKVCGAGGGGCVVFLVEPEARTRVIEALRKAGGTVLGCRVARDGLNVTVSGKVSSITPPLGRKERGRGMGHPGGDSARKAGESPASTRIQR